MVAKKKYVVYELNKLLGSDVNLSLEKIEFKGWTNNAFDSEEDAIQALVEDGKTYIDYLILPQVYITHS